MAFEAKANVMRDDVKWAGNIACIRSELQKIVKQNQLMRAIEKYLREHLELQGRVTRVVPVFTVLDPVFACPGLEAEVQRAVSKPVLEYRVDDPHLLFVGELELAGLYIREGLLAKLLDVRRSVAGAGWVTLGQVISRHKSTVTSALGQWLEPYDAHEGTRDALNELLRDFQVRHGGALSHV